MYQHYKVILCKSLKIKQYKKFTGVQQTKVCQNTKNKHKKKQSYKKFTLIQSNYFFKTDQNCPMLYDILLCVIV